MANYTMTIAEMLNNPLTREIFPTDYLFYDDEPSVKEEFERKFIEHFYYREIGFETPFIFKQRLNALLLLKMPYWIKLYQTELESKSINFLLNKDLKETFIREIESQNTMTGNSTLEQTNKGTSSNETTQTTSGTMSSSSESDATHSGTTTSTGKESLLRDGVAAASLSDGYLTGTTSSDGTSSQTDTSSDSSSATSRQEGTTTDSSSATSKDDLSSSGTATSSGNMTSTGSSSQNDTGKTLEKTELLSQGNIGITSSADLIKGWREILINMDEIIISECEKLFMRLY